VEPLTQVRAEQTIKALVQTPGALAAPAAAFAFFNDPTLRDLAIGFGGGLAIGVVFNGWMMWLLRRSRLGGSAAVARLPENASCEPAEETRRYHLVRLPLYLAGDAVVIAVFAFIGAGLLVAVTVTSFVLDWRLRAWEDRANATLFYERGKLWDLRRPRKPYWYYKPRVSSTD
jgi:hypothetical protein